MHLEEFASGGSFLHRLDPRVKILSAFPLMLIIALKEGPRGPAVALVLALCLCASARLEAGKLLQRLCAANFFVLFIWIFLPFTVPGQRVLFTVGPLICTYEGLEMSLLITLKTNAIVLLTIGLLGTTEVFALAHALVHLGAPNKLVHLFFFFYRYLGVLHLEYERMLKALRVRAFRPTSNMHTYRTYAWLAGMLLVRSFERSERVYGAMLCRGFKDRFPIMRHFSLRPADGLFATLMAVLGAGLYITGG